MRQTKVAGGNLVYLYGMISPSTVYILDEEFSYPQPNQYAEIKRSLPSLGGEAVNSAIVLSKFGIRTKLDGNWINQKHAEKVFVILKPYDIDVSRLTVHSDYGTEEIVITDRNTRTVFGNYAHFHSGERQWNVPEEDDITNAALVSLDPYLRDESLRVAELCVLHQKPYVTIDCTYDDFMARNAEALIISHELRDKAYPIADCSKFSSSIRRVAKGSSSSRSAPMSFGMRAVDK